MTESRSWLVRSLRGAAFWAARRSTDPARPGDRSFSGRSLAGVYITPDVALRNATVWAGVTYMARTMGALPWNVALLDGSGSTTQQPNHPIRWLLNTRPNPEWSAFQFRESLIGWAMLWGNGYAEIERNASGRPSALWPIHPSRVTVERDQAGALVYTVDNETQGRVSIPAQDMFHIRGYGDGVVGLNVAQYAAESLGWARATEMFGSTFFGEGLNPSAVIESAGGLTIEAKAKLRAELNELHRGPRRGHRIAILDAAQKLVKLSTPPEEAQFIETRQHQIEEICRWLGVPPHKVMHLLHAHFNNIEHQGIEVVVDSVTPWAKRCELEADYKLFGNNRMGLYTKLNLNALMRGDAKSRGEFYGLLEQAGAISPNEIRSLEDMNGIGPRGDIYVMQGQMMTLENIALQKTVAPAPGAPAPARTRTPEPEPEEEDEDMDAQDAARLERILGVLSAA